MSGIKNITGGGAENYREPVASSTVLPLVGNQDGDLRITLDTHDLYVWNEGTTSWDIISSGGGGAVDSVNGYTGTVVLTKSDVGLSNVDNTSDLNKPISTATQTALNAKVTGPASSTDEAIARYDGTTGKLVQNSSATIDDTGIIKTISDQIQIGSSDGFLRKQIWNYLVNSIFRMGSLGQDGDVPGDVSSEGAVFYGQNAQGDPMSSATGDFGYARIKPMRFGLYNSKTNLADYIFRVDETSLFLKNNSYTKTFEVTRSTGNIKTALSSGVVSADVSGNLTSTPVTTTEIGYVSGVTSAIQTQINDLNVRTPSSNGPVVLTDNTVSPTLAFSVPVANDAIIIEYSLKRDSSRKVGHLLITTNGSSVAITGDGIDLLNDTGVTFSVVINGANIDVKYITTSTGFNASLKYNVKSWIS